jgi:hypothetical protein
MSLLWTCPFCDRHSVVTDANHSQSRAWFEISNAHGPRMIQLDFIVCPNKECREFTITGAMFPYSRGGGGTQPRTVVALLAADSVFQG